MSDTDKVQVRVHLRAEGHVEINLSAEEWATLNGQLDSGDHPNADELPIDWLNAINLLRFEVEDADEVKPKKAVRRG